MEKKFQFFSKIGPGEEIYGIDGNDKNKYFKGIVVGITFDFTNKGENEYPDVWYILSIGNDQVKIVLEENVFNSREELVNRLKNK